MSRTIIIPGTGGPLGFICGTFNDQFIFGNVSYAVDYHWPWIDSLQKDELIKIGATITNKTVRCWPNNPIKVWNLALHYASVYTGNDFDQNSIDDIKRALIQHYPYIIFLYLIPFYFIIVAGLCVVYYTERNRPEEEKT